MSATTDCCCATAVPMTRRRRVLFAGEFDVAAIDGGGTQWHRVRCLPLLLARPPHLSRLLHSRRATGMGRGAVGPPPPRAPRAAEATPWTRRHPGGADCRSRASAGRGDGRALGPAAGARGGQEGGSAVEAGGAAEAAGFAPATFYSPSPAMRCSLCHAADSLRNAASAPRWRRCGGLSVTTTRRWRRRGRAR